MTMTTDGRTEVLELAPLGPEPWGSKLARARTQAGFTSLEKVAALVPEMSKSTLGRLEKRRTPPTSSKDRLRVALVCVLYRIDPVDLAVSLDDLPPYINRESLSDLGRTAYRCTGHLVGAAA